MVNDDRKHITDTCSAVAIFRSWPGSYTLSRVPIVALDYTHRARICHRITPLFLEKTGLGMSRTPSDLQDGEPEA
jgi:hypothetical protein